MSFLHLLLRTVEATGPLGDLDGDSAGCSDNSPAFLLFITAQIPIIEWDQRGLRPTLN